MASEAINMAIIANMHTDFRVIEVADYKCDIKFYLKIHWSCLEANMTSESEAIKIAVRGKMHIDVRVV